MGSIKNSSMNPEQEHKLTEAEFNYVMNMQTAKQTNLEQSNKMISAFLKYITASRLKYNADDDLQFELDFSDEKHILKVTRLPKDTIDKPIDN